VGTVVSLAVAAIQPPSAIFREEQRFGWWLYALLAAMMAVAWSMLLGQRPGVANPGAGPHGQILIASIAAGLVLPVLLVVGVLRMTTVVTPTEVHVWFGFLPTYRRALPFGSIARAEIVQYRPIRDHGGWGIRSTRDGERVFNARGDRGVRLHLLDGSKVLIGSQRPEELFLAVEGALRPGV